MTDQDTKALGYALMTGYQFTSDGDDTIVVNPKGTRYIISQGGCSCPAKRFTPGTLCKHERNASALYAMVWGSELKSC